MFSTTHYKRLIFGVLASFLFYTVTPAMAIVIPNDPEFHRQWYFRQIQALDAWEQTTGSKEAVVAILDTGVDIEHPDLVNNIWVNPRETVNGVDDDKNGYIDDIHGWNFVENTANVKPKASPNASTAIHHGTIVAGVLAAQGNNGIGITGVAWNIKIMPLRALNNEGVGNTTAVVRAIDYAVMNGAHIINMSFVGLDFSPSLERAIERAHKANVAIVAAAGNDNLNKTVLNLDETPAYPICHDGPNGKNWIIGVAALDTLDQKTKFSNYGKCVDVSAPGVGIYGTVLYAPEVEGFDSLYRGLWSGTSVAAPQVSGTVALMKTIYPKLRPDDALRIIRDTASAIDGTNLSFVGKLGGGRLNMRAALEQLLKEKGRLSVQMPTPARILTAAAGKFPAEIKIVGENGEVGKSIIAFPPAFKGGAFPTSGDFDGDGKGELVIGAGFGGGPHIRIFTSEGALIGNFFAFDNSFRGGVAVAALDINNDGKDEIVAAPGPGTTPHVRIFRADGQPLTGFLAYDARFRGGVNVATGDIDGDGKAEIITGAGAGGGPHVRIFDSYGRPKYRGFFAYDIRFRGGVQVAVGDIDGDGKAEIITGAGAGGGPYVRIWDEQGNLKMEFQAFDAANRSGIFVAGVDVEGDGVSEIIVGAGAGSPPLVRVFTPIGVLRAQFNAYSTNMRDGVRVAGIK